MIEIKNAITSLCENASFEEKINIINELREHLHELSPFKNEPVDFVKWVPVDTVVSNDYNPNKVAPPEMELLEISIVNDGYTQPIVTWRNEENKVEVIDGFHRNRVGKESKLVKQRIQGYLPVVAIRNEQSSKNDRIASTIRHNRARGKHLVNAMSEIVIDLKNRNWKNERIARELGMDMDEVLRLMQITGLESLFKDDDFSKSWNIEDTELEFQELTDEVTEQEREANKFRTVNTSDETRIFHTYDKWECFKAGFYETTKEGMTEHECEQEYYNLLTNLELFESTLQKVITEWKFSCEHYLTNKSMNRIAWLGQAALCYTKGIPSTFRGGFHILSDSQKDAANKMALKYLNQWLEKNNTAPVTLEEGLIIDRQAEVY